MDKPSPSADCYRNRPTKRLIEKFREEHRGAWHKLIQEMKFDTVSPEISAQIAKFLTCNYKAASAALSSVAALEMREAAWLFSLRERSWEGLSEHEQLLISCLKRLLDEEPDLWQQAQDVGSSGREFARSNSALMVWLMRDMGFEDVRDALCVMVRIRNLAGLVQVGFKVEVEEIVKW